MNNLENSPQDTPENRAYQYLSNWVERAPQQRGYTLRREFGRCQLTIFDYTRSFEAAAPLWERTTTGLTLEQAVNNLKQWMNGEL